MGKKITPSAKQKSQLIIHAIAFIVVNVLLWLFYDKGGMRVDVNGWAYPWPIWITAAWGLGLIGHWAALFANYQDAGTDEYLRQAKGN